MVLLCSNQAQKSGTVCKHSQHGLCVSGVGEAAEPPEGTGTVRSCNSPKTHFLHWEVTSPLRSETKRQLHLNKVK